VVTILALAAAVLYGTADFLGGVASRRASVFAVLALTVPAGAVVMLLAALLGQVPAIGGLLGHGGLGSSASLGNWSAVGWAAASGVCGAVGLVAFYAGFATAPISVVAPVAALVSAVLPVSVAIALPTAQATTGIFERAAAAKAPFKNLPIWRFSSNVPSGKNISDWPWAATFSTRRASAAPL